MDCTPNRTVRYRVTGILHSVARQVTPTAVCTTGAHFNEAAGCLLSVEGESSISENPASRVSKPLSDVACVTAYIAATGYETLEHGTGIGRTGSQKRAENSLTGWQTVVRYRRTGSSKRLAKR